MSGTYEVGEDFDSIHIDADIEDIHFVLSENEGCKVVCYEEENAPHHVWVENDTLMINKEHKNHFMFVATETPQITVYLPKNNYGSLVIDSDTGDTVIPKELSFESIDVELSTGDVTCSASADETAFFKTDTGEIRISDISAADIELASDTGNISLSDAVLTGNIKIGSDTGSAALNHVSCHGLICSTDTGDIHFTDVIAKGKFELESSTGDIKFDSCDAAEIYAKTDTGDITGTLLGDKMFLTETDTGTIRVPKTAAGGSCELTTSTGDIMIELK